MGLGKLRSVVVVDASGRVVGGLGDDIANGPLEGPGIERVALANGGFLITRPAPTSDAWSRYSRAFIHEARSPLNALAIYLELLANRLAPGAAASDRRDASPDRILSKANDQIRRVEELLRAFGELWGSRGETAHLSEMMSAVARFSEHEAHRLGLTFSAEVIPAVHVRIPAQVMAEALVLLLGAVFRSPPDSHVGVRLSATESAATIAVDLSGANISPEMAIDLLTPGADALRAIGGTVEMQGKHVTALFPRLTA